jgi:hypothetical protein
MTICNLSASSKPGVLESSQASSLTPVLDRFSTTSVRATPDGEVNTVAGIGIGVSNVTSYLPVAFLLTL